MLLSSTRPSFNNTRISGVSNEPHGTHSTDRPQVKGAGYGIQPSDAGQSRISVADIAFWQVARQELRRTEFDQPRTIKPVDSVEFGKVARQGAQVALRAEPFGRSIDL